MTIPDRLRGFPLWHGKVVHYTVHRRPPDGTPDFKTINWRNRTVALKNNLCHICGQPLLVPMVFIVSEEMLQLPTLGFTDGPMHEECAAFAVATCPYLADRNYKPSSAEPRENEFVALPTPPRPRRMAFYFTDGYKCRGLAILPNAATRIDWDVIPEFKE